MGNIVKETRSELKKVIWPTAKDVVTGTAAVVAISAIVGLFVFATDMVSGWFIADIIIGKVGALLG